MKQLLGNLAAVAALALLTASVSQAASVYKLQGNVAINKGSGYAAVTNRTSGKAGDVVIAYPGGRADIVYSDSCHVYVEPGETTTIEEEAPCAAGYLPTTEPWGMAVAIGAGAGITAYFMAKDNDKPKSP